jgi:lysozyme
VSTEADPERPSATRRRSFLVVTAAGAILLVVLVALTPPRRAPARCANRRRGIDVSSFQHTIDWQQVSSACLGFIYVRISAGTTPDVNAASNLAGARTTTAAVGAYQYFHPGQDVFAQAQLMIASSDHQSGDLPPAIDVETTDGLPLPQVIANIQDWLTTVEDALGVRPLIYSSPTFWSAHIHATSLTAYSLWVANYTTAHEPTLPLGGWPGGWTLWQYSRTGHVPGIETQVDLDRAATAFSG